MASAGPSVGIRTRSMTANLKRPATKELERSSAAHAASERNTDVQTQAPVPLKYVVEEAVKRWFEDTQQEASRGDVKQQALLGQMYNEGYGCKKDREAAKEWTQKAANKGYRMAGVYDVN